MQGIVFAAQAFVAGFGALVYVLFHGHTTAAVLRFIGL
jgi:hypothetical protein